MEILANVAYLLYFLAYAVRNILWLRLITVAAACLTMPYFYLQDPDPLWTPLVWATLFAGINGIQIVDLIFEKTPIGLSDDESAVFAKFSRFMTARQFKRLARVGHWRTLTPGEALVQRGSTPEQLLVLSGGEAFVEVDGNKVAQMLAGEFIGELAYITDDVASADVVAHTPCRCLCWPVAALRQYLRQHPDVAIAMEGVLGADVAAKLRRRTWSVGQRGA